METAAALESPLLCVETGGLPEAPPKPRRRPKISAEQAGLILIPTFAAPEQEEDEPAPAKTPQEMAFESQVDTAMVALAALADRFNVTVACTVTCLRSPHLSVFCCRRDVPGLGLTWIQFRFCGTAGKWTRCLHGSGRSFGMCAHGMLWWEQTGGPSPRRSDGAIPSGITC